MAEWERIIAKGVIPSSFLNEEIRNDFLVDVTRKKIWLVQLDMLFEIDRICKKNSASEFFQIQKTTILDFAYYFSETGEIA